MYRVLSAFLASANARTQTERRHAFYVACVGQNAVSRRVVQEICLRSFCVGLLREPRPRDKKCIFLCENVERKFQKSVLTCILRGLRGTTPRFV